MKRTALDNLFDSKEEIIIVNFFEIVLNRCQTFASDLSY